MVVFNEIGLLSYRCCWRCRRGLLGLLVYTDNTVYTVYKAQVQHPAGLAALLAPPTLDSQPRSSRRYGKHHLSQLVRPLRQCFALTLLRLFVQHAGFVLPFSIMLLQELSQVLRQQVFSVLAEQAHMHPAGMSLEVVHQYRGHENIPSLHALFAALLGHPA